MFKAYLTIDDSPSGRTNELIDFLEQRAIPALLFASGNTMEQRLDPIVRAIQKGFVIGNHGYDHKPAGDMGFAAWAIDFDKTEKLINRAYQEAGVKRPGLYYRFPYIDRGDGVRVERDFASGKGRDFAETPRTLEFQEYLKTKGASQPFADMPETYPAQASDCLFTYTAGDWMLSARHTGKWEYKTIDDLKARIDADEGLRGPGPHIVLMHDQADIFTEVCALIDYFQAQGFEFLDFGRAAN